MIVSVRDAENNLADGAAVTALLAGITSISKSKNTLALQFTEGMDVSVLDILSGKAIRMNRIKESFSYMDDGLDALFLRAETADLTKEHYDECVTPLLEKENMLDVLKPTRSHRIGGIVSSETLKNVLRHAEEVYDYVFVLLPDDKGLLELTSAYTKEDILVVSQGRQIQEDKLGEKTCLVVKDFEPMSRYDVPSMKKKYGKRKIYTVPHNVEYRDNVINQTLLDFLLTNKKNIKEDENYLFTSSILSMVSRYISDQGGDEPELTLQDKPQAGGLVSEEATVLPEGAIQEVTVKKGLFRRESRIMIDL